ncbi:MAG: CHRD domain-containing protein [Pirellulales bacterium]
MKRTGLLAMAAAVALVTMASAQGAILQFVAFPDGIQETPPVATPASGDASMMVNDATGDWTLTGNFFNLLANVTAAHIHGPAPPGTPAGVITGGTLTPSAGTTGTLTGAGTLSALQFAELTAGLYYVNVHSQFRPGGEIRGQLGLIPEPATVVLFGVGAAGLLCVAWRRRRKPARQ